MNQVSTYRFFIDSNQIFDCYTEKSTLTLSTTHVTQVE